MQKLSLQVKNMAAVDRTSIGRKETDDIRNDDDLKTIEAQVELTDSGTSGGSDIADPAVARMTLAKWLACIALGTCFTTAYQQNLTTSAIVKHIDNALGMMLFVDLYHQSL